MVRRIYVEKKEGFDVEARGLFADISENLGLNGLSGVRIVNRYDIEGIDDATYDRVKYIVFAEPAVDKAYDEELPEGLGDKVFAVGYLPGQYDQRADSAAQCIKLIDPSAEATVRFAKVIALLGDVSDEEFAAVKKYCVNPVDSQETGFDKPATLAMASAVPPDVAVIEGFTSSDEASLEDMRKSMGLAMSHDDIMCVYDYFRNDEKRDPTLTEIRVIDTYWSDHCRHTTFQTQLNDITFEEGPYADIVKKAFGEYMKTREYVYGDREKDVCLMDLATIGAKYLKKEGLADNIDESDEINACSIKVKADIDGREEDWLVMFKNETHNHPTEIEPFGGAATCLGGAIRDPLSGRVYVYQAMRVTGCADPRTPVSETMEGKLPQRKLTTQAAHGYSSYGNQIGLATGQVAEIYDEGYVAKRMEVGAVVGAAPASHVRREAPKEGDVIILVGGRTGRDGCGGATGSSKEHTKESILECGAEVQKGNPPVERNIQRLFRRKEVATMIKRCNDFGAGGVSVAIGELTDGIDVDLDLVPKKYDGLDGTELAISESQERMAVVVAGSDADRFIGYADEENLEATKVAKVTGMNRFRMFWRGKIILDLSRDFLNTNGAKQQAAVRVNDIKDLAGIFDSGEEGKELKEFLSDLNCCSQKGLTERFDSTIGAATVLMPLGGKYQLSPAAGMAAKLPVTEGNTSTATLMAYGFDPKLSKKSPFYGAYYAVIESVSKIAAMGGDYTGIRMSFQEYFEKMTEDPTTWALPFQALLGALKAQKELGLPAIGGKDSMSGTFMDINVPPTLIAFSLGVLNAADVMSTEFKATDSKLVYLYAPKNEDMLLDSEQFKKNMMRVHELADAHKILAANTIGRGGLFIAAVKMAVGNRIGFEMNDVTGKELRTPDYGSLLIEVPEGENIAQMFEDTTYRIIGRTTDREQLEINAREADGSVKHETMAMEQVIKAWTAPLESVFPVRTVEFRNKPDTAVVPKISYHEHGPRKCAVSVAKPRVVIPTFPGTNCETDSKRAFERAGAQAEIHIIRNLSEAELVDSIKELERKIRESQIVMIPGGFSGGDEPDGSAKFITAVFRNPRIADAVADLLENRDGLMLGICNGFQALIKLGLVPEGKITAQTENSPTLTYNRIGRHMSCLVRTRVASVKSPWLMNAKVGDIHTVAISHGEGRFIADPETLDRLIRNGQVATQYVNLAGEPSMDIKYNPNYSAYAIEGITSPDGRVLGKMGHSERIGINVYKNVEGNKDQQIFESGVAYYR